MLKCHEVPCLPSKTTLQLALKHSTRKGFAASPIDTATAPQTPATRDETCWSIRTNISSSQRQNFQHSSKNATPSTEFAPCHHFAQHWQCDSPKKTQHDTSKVLRLPHKMTPELSKVLRLPRKMQRIFWKHGKSIAPATQNDSWHVLKHVGMSPSATPATRNEATRRWKAPKVTPFAELPFGTAIRPSRERLRTAADGCGCKRNVRRTQLNPHIPRVKREPFATHSGKITVTQKQLFEHYSLAFPHTHTPPHSTALEICMCVCLLLWKLTNLLNWEQWKSRQVIKESTSNRKQSKDLTRLHLKSACVCVSACYCGCWPTFWTNNENHAK